MMPEPHADPLPGADEELAQLRRRVAELEQTGEVVVRLREELAEQRAMNRAMLNAAAESVMVLDPLGTVLAINEVGAHRLGKTPDTLLGRSIFEFMAEELVPNRRRWLNEAVETKKPLQFKDSHRGVTYGHRMHPYIDPLTQVVRVAIYTRDITDSEKAILALRDSEARYRAILEDQTELICRYLPDGKLSYVNEAYARFFNKNRQDLINKNYIPHIPREDLVVIQQHIMGLSPENPVTSFEHRVIMDNREIHWQHWTHRAIYDAAQRLTEYQAVGRNITRRKKAQEALMESERRYRSLFEDSPISLWEEDFSLIKEHFDHLTRQGVTDMAAWFRDHPEDVVHCAGLVGLLDVNKATLELFGASRKEELLDGLGTIFTPEAFERFRDELVALAQGQRSFSAETTHLTLQGERKHVVIHLNVAPGYEDTLGKVLVSVLDVTQRTLAEEQLNEQRVFLRQIIDTVPSLIFVKNREGRFLLVNKALADLYATTPAALVGRTGGGFSPDDDEISIMQLEDEEVLDSQQPLFIPQRTLTSASGVRRWFSTTKLPLRGKDQLLGVAVDITERKEAENERAKLERHFRQAQKMQALGTLAGGIAHDFNNMIFAILGFVRLALRQVDENSKTFEYLQQIQSAGMRASDLVRQILTFSRQTEQEKKPVHLLSLFKEITKMLRATLPATIDIVQDISPGVDESTDTILGDPTQIHQVIMNLCTNAGHAMRERGGTLTISLVHVSLSPQQARGVVELPPGDYLELGVRDTGHGIPPDILEQIYDPFFTTKAPGEGTGMGLSVVHGIVKNHGGSVAVDTAMGKGTLFTVRLPRLYQDSDQEERLCRISPTGKEHILFVDDEALLVQMAGEMLSQLGYTVTGATDPLKALEQYRQTPTKFELVITDQTMPHMTGLELATQVLAMHPDKPVILLTGYSESVTRESAEAAGVAEFIMKPVVEEQLAQTIRHVLDQRGRMRV
ncbi:putative PAS/PAC sensor protein [Megalodesulfovibrio gigas DSM 1382 = ATCC 19364]|uniref:histidine kinase n=2 Tax=Megalodesulfovibrio gigas TaxID=879 RepID=T2GDK6_MEGG1|nr:putative PAS/PAC sensor protein [Megalodesulfovibrio gigas DSM 1382 = ATCC 19364]